MLLFYWSHAHKAASDWVKTDRVRPMTKQNMCSNVKCTSKLSRVIILHSVTHLVSGSIISIIKVEFSAALVRRG